MQIGTVRSVNPARREVRVEPLASRVHEFEDLDWIRALPIQHTAGTPLPKRRVAAVRDAGLVVITLVPGVSRDAVAKMKGCVLVVAANELRPRPEGCWEARELVGMKVTGADGMPLGHVADAFSTGANDVLVIEAPDGASLSLPVIEETVAKVDLARGEIVLGEIEAHAVWEPARGCEP